MCFVVSTLCVEPDHFA